MAALVPVFQGSWIFFLLSFISQQTISNILFGMLESTNSNFRAVGGLTRRIPSRNKDAHLQMVLDHVEYVINNNANWSLSWYHLYPNSENWRLLSRYGIGIALWFVMVPQYGIGIALWFVMVLQYGMLWYRVMVCYEIMLWYRVMVWYCVMVYGIWYCIMVW